MVQEANLNKGVSDRLPLIHAPDRCEPSGWVAHAQDVSLAHMWEEKLIWTHINVLELLMVFRVLKLPERRGCGHLWLFPCYNTQRFPTRQGGTRSQLLGLLAEIPRILVPPDHSCGSICSTSGPPSRTVSAARTHEI